MWIFNAEENYSFLIELELRRWIFNAEENYSFLIELELRR